MLKAPFPDIVRPSELNKTGPFILNIKCEVFYETNSSYLLLVILPILPILIRSDNVLFVYTGISCMTSKFCIHTQILLKLVTEISGLTLEISGRIKDQQKQTNFLLNMKFEVVY